MIICYDNQIINLDMGWKAIHIIVCGDFGWETSPLVYSLTIELNDKSSCNLGVFTEDEYWLAKMMMDKIKEGLTNNISFLDLDDYLKMWKKKLEKEKETKNE
jgi:hypothetical protein|uniref:Uncharacterized protein n=1 Tax=Bacteriophage sp. TaxID=38018 RepID=A0A8D9UHQ0_9VIRU|nr:MAG TPA: hypothetical protein [Bacteriophage sp.]